MVARVASPHAREEPDGARSSMRRRTYLGPITPELAMRTFIFDASYIRGIYTQAFEMNPTSLRCVDSWVHDTEDDDDVQAEKPRYFQRVMDAQPMLKVPKWVVKALGGLPPYTETLTVDTQTGKIHGTAMPGGVPVVITIDMGILAGRSPDGKEMGAWVDAEFSAYVRIPVVGKLLGLFILATSKKFQKKMGEFVHAYHGPGGDAEKVAAEVAAKVARQEPAFLAATSLGRLDSFYLRDLMGVEAEDVPTTQCERWHTPPPSRTSRFSRWFQCFAAQTTRDNHDAKGRSASAEPVVAAAAA